MGDTGGNIMNCKLEGIALFAAMLENNRDKEARSARREGFHGIGFFEFGRAFNPSHVNSVTKKGHFLSLLLVPNTEAEQPHKPSRDKRYGVARRQKGERQWQQGSCYRSIYLLHKSRL